MPLRRLLPVPVALLAAAACADPSSTALSGPSDPSLVAAAEAITADALLRGIEDLAADSMEGRAPGTPAEEKTLPYLQRRFEGLGLLPGNPDGSWFQTVDLIGYTSRPTTTIAAGGQRLALDYPADYVAGSRHDQPLVRVTDSEVVFVGYGVVAPEYGWDDYKGLDVSGKTLLMLVNDPPVRFEGEGAPLDTTMFRGPAMTYYGRWTYKYEIATDLDAAAVLVIHETGPAGYPWEVVRGSWTGEQLDVPSPDAADRVPVEGWITLEKARELFAMGGEDFDSLHAAARRSDFTPVTLDATASFDVGIDVRRIQSQNVVARLEGADAPDEYVIYSAHWDHLGRDPSLDGDQIFNGALDNASGTAGMIEIAKAFTRLEPPPARSVLFLAVTAEESGLLGAKYYAANPLYPLTRTVADINIDGVNQWGPTRDLTVIGLGNSTLDDVVERVLAADGRTVRPDPEPEKGFYYRSDHFEFAKRGVPALFSDAGIDYIGRPDDYGIERRDEYTNHDYHAVTDEVKPDWDLSGAVEDLRVLFRVGALVADAPGIPEWKPGTEFKALRDSMMVGG